MSKRVRQLGLLAAGCSLSLVLAASNAVGAPTQRVVQMLDDCDPATFNATIGSGTCVGDGTTTFDEFVNQLTTHRRAPAWRFSPSALKLASRATITAVNRGGEVHTFTEVAAFGGGIVPFLNNLVGLTGVVPEGGALGPEDFIAPGASTTTAPLSRGTHRFECLIHPWMRATAQVQ